MAAIAREPLVFVPLVGTRDQGGGEPPAPAPASLDAAGSPAVHATHASKPFLHVLAGNEIAALALPSCADTDTNARAIDPNTRVINLHGSTVSGAVLASDPRAAAVPCISEISFEGTSFAVPDARSLQVPGNFGTLTVSASGTFAYTRTVAACEFIDAFICTARMAGEPVRITLEIVSLPELDELPFACAS